MTCRRSPLTLLVSLLAVGLLAGSSPAGASRYRRRKFASNSVYYCGALMLDRLHAMLPAATFASVLKQWPRLHRFGSVHLSEWISYLDRVTGRNLRGFVTAWLDSPITPS